MASLDDIATGDTSDDTTDAASDDGDTAPATSEPVDAEPVDMEQAMLDFAACMRSHGVDMPDPEVDENGGVMIQIGSGDDQGPQDNMQEAMEDCQDKMPRGPVTRDGGGFDPTEMQDEMLEFAQCMRSHGVDMPDPDFDENGRLADSESVTVTAPEGEDGPTAVLSGPFGVLEMNDPATIEAFEACSEGTMFGGTRVAVDSARDEAGE